MSTKTVTITLPLSHLYHLTADSANDTGYTIEQVTEMLKEHGPAYEIEATITTPVPEVSEEIIETTDEEIIELVDENDYQIDDI